MKVRVHEWSNDSEGWLRDTIVPQRFAAIDPGAHGAVVVRGPGHADPFGFCMLGLSSDAAVEAVFGVRLLVIEAQYFASNAMTAIRLARSASAFVSYVAGLRAARGFETDVLWVPPATWQAYQRRLAGVKGKLQRGDGKALAMACAKASRIGRSGAFVRASEADQEGVADAWGLSEWVLGGLWCLNAT